MSVYSFWRMIDYYILMFSSCFFMSYSIWNIAFFPFCCPFYNDSTESIFGGFRFLIFMLDEIWKTSLIIGIFGCGLLPRKIELFLDHDSWYAVAIFVLCEGVSTFELYLEDHFTWPKIFYALFDCINLGVFILSPKYLRMVLDLFLLIKLQFLFSVICFLGWIWI